MSRLARALVAAAAVAALLPSGASAHTGSLTPSTVAVRLKVGQVRTIDYTFGMRPSSEPVDLYLLVDTSAGTTPHLPALRNGLRSAVMSLARAGSDVQVGVGELRTTGAGDWAGGVTYRMLRAVGPVDGSLDRALGRLGQDDAGPAAAVGGEVAHTVALDETVTGDGYAPYVSPGHGARFRPGVRRVVAVVTAEAFANDPLQPSRDEAVTALRAAGTRVVGLALDQAALGDLAAVARGTGAVADTDVDCGSGRVRRGQPAACTVAPDRLAGPLTGFLLRREVGEVTFATSGSVVRRFDAPPRKVYSGVSAEFPLRLTVGCAKAGAHAFDVSARLDGKVVARAIGHVSCETPPRPSRR